MAFGANSMLYLSEEQLVLTLKRRKNKLRGSVLARGCWCAASKLTCPVHVVGASLCDVAVGERLFRGITPISALVLLRRILGLLAVPDAGLYRTHDLRRGHAQDLAESGWRVGRSLTDRALEFLCLAGAPLYEILQAGEWSSPAFMKYLDIHKLDTELVVQAHYNESSDDDA